MDEYKKYSDYVKKNGRKIRFSISEELERYNKRIRYYLEMQNELRELLADLTREAVAEYKDEDNDSVTSESIQEYENDIIEIRDSVSLKSQERAIAICENIEKGGDFTLDHLKEIKDCLLNSKNLCASFLNLTKKLTQQKTVEKVENCHDWKSEMIIFQGKLNQALKGVEKISPSTPVTKALLAFKMNVEKAIDDYFKAMSVSAGNIAEALKALPQRRRMEKIDVENSIINDLGETICEKLKKLPSVAQLLCQQVKKESKEYTASCIKLFTEKYLGPTDKPMVEIMREMTEQLREDPKKVPSHFNNVLCDYNFSLLVEKEMCDVVTPEDAESKLKNILNLMRNNEDNYKYYIESHGFWVPILAYFRHPCVESRPVVDPYIFFKGKPSVPQPSRERKEKASLVMSSTF